MKKLFCLLSVSLILPAAFAQSKNFIDQPYLETSASVDTLVTPDRIYLEIRLKESDTRGKTSLEALEREMGTRLQALGIDLEKQLTVSDLSSDFHRYFLKGQEIQKEKVFELLVYDAPSAGRVLFELEKTGISNIRLVRTEYSGMQTLQETLKARAVRLGHRQGTIMAGALDQAIGKALFVSDSGFSVYNGLEGRGGGVMLAADQAESAYVALPADFDQIRVEARVQLKFRLD